MKIGLLGFGVVGKGVYEITAARDDMQVAKVLCLEDIQLPDAEVVGQVFGAFHRSVRDGIRPARALAEAKALLSDDDPLALLVGALQCHGRW